MWKIKTRGMKQQPEPSYPSICKIYLSQDSPLQAKPKQKRSPCVLILVPKTFSPLFICLFTLPCFHVQLYWTQTSELSSFVALTTRRPLIWWLSHWCIDGTEPVSLPASLSPSLQLSSYTDTQAPTSGLIKAVFTCQLLLLVFQVR